MSKLTSKPKTETKSKPKPIVLELRNVTFRSGVVNSIQLRNASLVVREGDLVMFRMNRSQNCRDLASALQGLQQPIQGEVLFQNQDWQGKDFDRHYRMRSRIGRVFDNHAWIQNFNVLENVTLASRHHHISDASINEKVGTWAKRFNVPFISHSRPPFVDAPVLQTYQWIRALIGKPALLILERPMNSVLIGQLPKLVEAINDARKNGAAVIWFTSNVGDWSDQMDSPRVDYKLSEGNFRKLSAGSDDE